MKNLPKEYYFPVENPVSPLTKMPQTLVKFYIKMQLENYKINDASYSYFLLELKITVKKREMSSNNKVMRKKM